MIYAETTLDNMVGSVGNITHTSDALGGSRDNINVCGGGGGRGGGQGGKGLFPGLVRYY